MAGRLLRYREELEAIMPGRKSRKEYRKEAKEESERKFGLIFGKYLRDSHLWTYLSVIVLIIGIGLYSYAKDIECSHKRASTQSTNIINYNGTDKLSASER